MSNKLIMKSLNIIGIAYIILGFVLVLFTDVFPIRYKTFNGARVVRESSLISLKPTGLLLRGITSITKIEYVRIRKEGLQPKDTGGVSKNPFNYAPNKVALSLCKDFVFSSSSLNRFGPLKDPNNVVFIIDPEYVKTHRDEFTLVGGNFYSTPVLLYDISAYTKGLQSLGLDGHEVNRYRAAMEDEIESDGIPPYAISGIIVDSSMVDSILEWDISNGFRHLPIYILDNINVGAPDEILLYEP